MLARRCALVLVLVPVFQLALARDAQAYLDPGSLNFILQSVFASLLAAAITLKLYWRRIVAGLRSRFSSASEDEESS